MKIWGDLPIAGLGAMVVAVIACGNPSPPFEPGWRFSQSYWGPSLPDVDPRSKPIPSPNVGGGMMPPIEIKTNSDGGATFKSDPTAVNNTGVTAQVTYADGTTGNPVTSQNAWQHGVSASSGHGGIASITSNLEVPVQGEGAGGALLAAGEGGGAPKLVPVQAGEDAAVGLGTKARRFFYDPRNFRREVSPEYWAGVDANGASLHHWLFPQRATWVPEGIRNAGFNLVELPGWKVYGRLDLNRWMGFARNWGPTQRVVAGTAENAIRVVIPGSVVAGGYGGYVVGSEIADDDR